MTIPLDGMPSEGVVKTKTSLVTLRSTDPGGRGAVMLIGSQELSESIIRTPIVSGDRVLGVISVQSYTPDFYTTDDVQALEAFAAVAARAIETIDLLALKRAGYAVLTAADGEEAMQVATMHQGVIDLLLTDVVMPRMGGPELASRLRERTPNLPVIFMWVCR